MPAASQAQQRLMGACSHGANWASCPKMSKDKMLDFARTSHKGLPNRVGKSYARGTANVQLGDTSPLPKSIYGSDIVPAALTPDEMVLTPKQQSGVMAIPGKEHKLLPSQLKKIHALGKKKGMIPAGKGRNLRIPIPRLQFKFGSAEVGGGDPGGNIGNYSANPNLFYGDGFFSGSGSAPAMRGVFMHPSGLANRSFSPQSSGWGWGAPGMPWSPTMVPTAYNNQGYPRAVPVMPPSPDYGSYGPHPHTPPKSNS